MGHDVEIEIGSPGVRARAIVTIDGKRVEGLFDYGVDFGTQAGDRVAVTLKIWPERFRLTVRDAIVIASAADPRGTIALQKAIDAG